MNGYGIVDGGPRIGFFAVQLPRVNRKAIDRTSHEARMGTQDIRISLQIIHCMVLAAAIAAAVLSHTIPSIHVLS